MTQRYAKAALGGTFDHLHTGHYQLLTTAFAHADEVLIGLTSDVMNRSKIVSHQIQSYASRLHHLQDYLKSQGIANRATIIQLTDVYGTTLTDQSIQVLVVTRHTMPGATQINQARLSLNLPKLPIITAPLIRDQANTYISSTRIRQGFIDRQGRVYAQVFQSNLSISPSLRRQLKQPQGVLLQTKEEIMHQLKNSIPTKICLVGDYITQWFHDHRLPFDYAVVDGYNQRQPFTLNLSQWSRSHSLSVDNPAGTIQLQLVAAMQQLVSHPSGLLTVNGEEDLAALPASLLLPLGSRLFYGQPGQGVVMIQITEHVKHKLASMINIDF